MMRVRPIQRDDLEGLVSVANATGVGMTSIPKNRNVLQKMVDDSLTSFSKTLSQPENEAYLFVLEDTSNGDIGGTCAIYSKTGVIEPVYFYELETEERGFKVLHPVLRQNGPSELCSLYLRPEYRKEGLGKLLSFSRFLFVAAHRQRFDDTLYAELRGFIDKNQSSPFWDGLGRHFFNCTFDEINRMLDGKKNAYIESLPRYPVYLWMLAKSAQNAVGKTHTNTRSALKMLQEEGFHITSIINTIDAGPIVEAKMEEIRTIVASQVATIEAFTQNTLSSKQYLVSNNALNFRACYGKVKVKRNGQVVLTADVAEALQVDVGDQVRFVPAKLRK